MKVEDRGGSRQDNAQQGYYKRMGAIPASVINELRLEWMLFW
jgi:hypothetical protein